MADPVRITVVAEFISTLSQSFYNTGLLVSYFVASYQFRALITTLLADEEFSFGLFSAMAITNIVDAVRSIFVILAACLADAYIGDSRLLLYSAMTYFIGMLVWYFYEFSRVAALFYPAILLVTVGQCGRAKYDESDLDGRQENKSEVDDTENNVEETNVNQAKQIELISKKSLKRRTGISYGNLEELNNTKPETLLEVLPIIEDDQESIISTNLSNICSLCTTYIKEACNKLWLFIKSNMVTIIGLIIAVLLIPSILYPYGDIVVAIMLLSTIGIFSWGRKFYPFDIPQGAPLLSFFRVLIVACKNWRSDLVTRGCKYFGDDNSTDGDQVGSSTGHQSDYNPSFETHANANPDDTNASNDANVRDSSDGNSPEERGPVDFSDSFGCLNSAAYYIPTTKPKDLVAKWRLCTVKEVEDAKNFIKAMYLYTGSLLMYGVMTGVCNTYFYVQADQMDRTINNHKVPIELIAYLPDLFRELVRRVCQCLTSKREKEHYGLFRIGLSMLISLPCFFLAFTVESKRQEDVRNDMETSIFWLAPQLILLGVMDGLALDGIGQLFDQALPKCFGHIYGTILAEAVTSMGQLLGLLLAYILTSTIKTSPRLIGVDLNNSRLDKYYWYMFIFGIISFGVHCFVALIHYTSSLRVQRILAGPPSTS